MSKYELVKCPMQVVGVFDHPEYHDRYTVALEQVNYTRPDGQKVSFTPYISLNSGAGLYHGELSDYDTYAGENEDNVIEWGVLPENVRLAIYYDLDFMESLAG